MYAWLVGKLVASIVMNNAIEAWNAQSPKINTSLWGVASKRKGSLSLKHSKIKLAQQKLDPANHNMFIVICLHLFTET